MSHSVGTPAPDRGRDETTTTVEDGEAVQAVLDVLDDAECREILSATGERALTAKEVAEQCAVPLSTAYRKLDLLSDVGLLDERTRVHSSGHHASEYVRAVESVRIDVEDGARVVVSERSAPRQSALGD